MRPFVKRHRVRARMFPLRTLLAPLCLWMMIGIGAFVLYAAFYNPDFNNPSHVISVPIEEQTKIKIIENSKYKNNTGGARTPPTIVTPVAPPTAPIVKVNKPRLPKAPPTPNYLSICTIFKDEAPYIDEWIHFHIVVGVERFYLYNHNSSDESVEVLQEYIDQGWVILRTALDLTINDKTMTQVNSFKDCLDRYGAETRWMMFIDMDEFAFSPSADSLQDILVDYEKYPGVVMRNVFFGSSGHVTSPQGLVIENYLYRASLTGKGLSKTDDVLYHVKSIVDPSRAKVCPFDYPGICSHYFCYEGLDTDYKPSNPSSSTEFLYPVNEQFQRIVTPSAKGLPYIERLRFNHYKGKSYEDYTLGKMRKGTVQGKDGDMKFMKWGNIWRQVDINDVKDDAILRFVPQVRYNMGLAALETPVPPILNSLPSTNTVFFISGLKSRITRKPVHPNERLTALVLSPPGSAGQFIADMLEKMGSNTLQNPVIINNLLKELTLQQVSDPNQLSLGFDISTLSSYQRKSFFEIGTAILEKVHFLPKQEFGHLLPPLPEVEIPEPLPLIGYVYDNRLPVFTPLWRDLVSEEKSICIIVNTDPRMLAAHYKNGYPNIPVKSPSQPTDLIMSWEKHSIAAMKGCQDLPIIMVREEELINDPYSALLRLHRDLVVLIAEGSVRRLGMIALSYDQVTQLTIDWCDSHASLGLPFCNYVRVKRPEEVMKYGEEDYPFKEIELADVEEFARNLFDDINYGIAFNEDYGDYDSPTIVHNEKRLTLSWL
eukprot:TRINITY_DN1122_c0_g1_i1.p1 TRINITY_DN1122_c0_g1~~TRINITY_DN1122_c0_g1_i1.p1  ORF type:complete len:769 (+),score=119.40 TRINITY_DN1122_c0_g1_i1:297-2603(+)